MKATKSKTKKTYILNDRKKFLLYLLLIGLSYLLFWPVPINPVAWESPDAPALEGAYQPNDFLQDIDLYHEEYTGPEDIVLTSSEDEGHIYAGYDTEVGGVSVGLGYTAYEYTGTSDSEEEFTLSLGLGAVSLSYSDGEDLNATDYDYDVLSVSADVGGFTLTYGEYDQDSDGSDPEIVDYEWSEISTGTEVGAISLGLTLGSKSSGEDYLVLDMSTGIDL